MNIIVLLKQVPDTESKITINNNSTNIEMNNLKWVMNPYDEFAVEQAILIKAQNPSAIITAVRLGEPCDQDPLRTALAMGCDEAALINSTEQLDSLTIASAIERTLNKLGLTPDIIIAGKQAIDGDCAQVPQILAQKFGIPSVTGVSFMKQNGETYNVKRELEGGVQQEFELKTPFLITANKGLNTPRYPSLPGIMKAKKKQIQETKLAEINLSSDDNLLSFVDYKLPPEKAKGKKYTATEDSEIIAVVKEVAVALHNEKKLI